MIAENEQFSDSKKLAAVCGLYCKACTLYIGSTEDPERLAQLAVQFQSSEEEIMCFGCRSDKRGPYCKTCIIFSCAVERGIDFCVECSEYPCDDLKRFQSARPHRIELWDDQERIRAVGYKQWLNETQGRYSCIYCQTINSAYDLKCRKCGEEPSCAYVADNRHEIEQFLYNR